MKNSWKILLSVLLSLTSVLNAATITLDATEDAEIDGHINWRSDTKGIPHPEWSHPADELRVRIYDPNLYPGANASHVLIKWDLSAISTTNEVTNVTLEMSGWDYADGPIEAYGIELGEWYENSVSWNSWAVTPQNLILLGFFTSAGPASVTGQTTFADPDLTSWVQSWVNGTQANNGLIFIKSGSTPGGDSFSSREDTWSAGHAPQLKITYEPITVTLSGHIGLEGYVGDMSYVGIQAELRQGETLVKNERTLLDENGQFTLTDIPLGTYDLVIQVPSQLQKVIENITVSDNTDVGTVVLRGGDFDSDGLISQTDFQIMVENWLSIAHP